MPPSYVHETVKCTIDKWENRTDDWQLTDGKYDTIELLVINSIIIISKLVDYTCHIFNSYASQVIVVKY